jgi:hypothetical protein
MSTRQVVKSVPNVIAQALLMTTLSVIWGYPEASSSGNQS